jgi:hypothetical protein
MGEAQRGLASKASSPVLVVVLLVLAACGSGAAGTPGRAEVARRSPAASTASRIVYNGGQVLADAEVVVVFWGNDLPASVVERTPDIYRTLTELNDFDWISEYDTASQHIRRPTFLGQVVIDPGDAGTRLLDGGTKLFEQDIVAELVKQLDAGVLPAPTENSYYAVHFPPGVTILAGVFEDRSCVEWSAYHGDLAPSAPGTYAVFPACGQTSPNAVHELFEAVTDPHDNDGWTTRSGDEIADLCGDSLTSLPLRDGGALDIQRLWSDVAGACLGSGNEFTISINPIVAPAAPVLTFTVSTIPPRNPYAQLSWKVSGLPGGATAAIVPQADAPGRWTLTVDLPQPYTKFSLAVEARTESWSASVSAGVYLGSASSTAATGCSQAAGSAWPVGVAATLLLWMVRLRRRA